MTSELLKFKPLESIQQPGTGAAPDLPVARVSWWKRSLDFCCLLVALPTVFLLMLGIAVLIKLVSPGPVFFMQERIGFMGRRFRMYKFRTMRVDAETGCHQEHLKTLINSNAPMTKMDAKGDPRVIPFGGILR